MPDHVKIYICNAKYGHHGNGKKEKEECAPCYCGWTGIDSDGCTCNVNNE